MKFLSKLKDLSVPKFSKPDTTIDLSEIEEKLQERFFGLLEKTYAEREGDTENSLKSKEDIDAIIKGYGNKNILIATAAGALPAPLGVISMVPEMVLILGNQMKMIYDVGCAYDKEDFFNKDVLLDIPLMALGGHSNLGELQNLTNLDDSPAEILKDKAGTLGKSIIEKNLKKSIVKFVPIGGSIIMGVWTKVANKKVSGKTIDFFDPAKILIGKEPLSLEIDYQLDLERIKALINLIESDGNINDEQIQFIIPMIEEIDLPRETKVQLIEEAQKTNSAFELNYDILRNNQDEMERMIMELVIMAKRDGELHSKELEYIFSVTKRLDMNKAFVEELLK